MNILFGCMLVYCQRLLLASTSTHTCLRLHNYAYMHTPTPVSTYTTHKCMYAHTHVHRCTHILQANLLISYLPNLSTKSPTRREPRKPPKGYMDTVTDHSSVRVKESRDSPVLSL